MMLTWLLPPRGDNSSHRDHPAGSVHPLVHVPSHRHVWAQVVTDRWWANLRWWSTSLDKQNNEISSCFRCHCSACRGLTSWLHCCHDESLVWGWGPHSNVWDQGWLGVSWKSSMPCQMPSVSQRQNWRVPQLEQVYNHDGKTQFLIFFSFFA